MVDTSPGDLAYLLATVGFGGRTLLGSKLSRAATRAAVSNPVTSAPWTAPPAYGLLTAYVPGNMISNGGSWYVCGIGGTTAAVSVGPTTTTSGQYVMDPGGGPYWTYYGGAQTPDTADGAPTVSTTTTNPSLGVDWWQSLYGNLYHVRGGTPVVDGSYYDIQTFNDNVNGQVSRGGSLSFECDDAKVAILVRAGGAVRILVNDRYLTPNTFSVAVNTWVIIDWSGTSGWRPRTYEIESTKTASFFGSVQTSSRGTIFPVQNTDEVRVAWISDSYAAGSAYGPWLGGGTMPMMTGKRLGWRDVWNYSIGGTGYQNPNGSYYVFGQRVPQVNASKPDVGVFMGSTNDVTYSAVSEQAAALAAFQAFRHGNPNTPLIVLGVPSINVTGGLASENAVSAAVTQFADPRTWFVPITAATPPWVLGTWNNSGYSTSGTPNNSSMYIAGDNIHPPEIGEWFYSAHIEQAIRAKVLPYI